MKNLSVLCATVLIIINAASVESATIPNTLYWLEADGSLNTFDELTGNTTFVTGTEGISRPGVGTIFDIEFSGSTLFGITTQKLLTVDPDNGQVSIIGNFNVSDNVVSMAISSSGELFASGQLAGEFYSVNTLTGEGAVIGSFGNGLTPEGGLAFSPQGTLYSAVNVPGDLTDWLATIDTLTGNATLIGDLGYTTVNGLSFKNNMLFGGEDGGNFLQVDTTTGAATSIAFNGKRLWAITTSPIPIPPALWLFGSGLIGLVGFARRG